MKKKMNKEIMDEHQRMLEFLYLNNNNNNNNNSERILHQ